MQPSEAPSLVNVIRIPRCASMKAPLAPTQATCPERRNTTICAPKPAAWTDRTIPGNAAALHAINPFTGWAGAAPPCDHDVDLYPGYGAQPLISLGQ
jgi:hypothetical protein